MVVRVVSFKALCTGHNDKLCTGAVQESSVMAYRNYATRKVQDVLLKTPQGIDVQIVCRLVQNKKVWIPYQRTEKVEPSSFTSGKNSDRKSVERSWKAEQLKESGRGDHIVGRKNYRLADVGKKLQRSLVQRKLCGGLVIIAEDGVDSSVDFSAFGCEVSCHDLQKSTLSASVFADDSESLALDELKIEAVQNLFASSGNCDVLKLQNLFTHAAGDA